MLRYSLKIVRELKAAGDGEQINYWKKVLTQLPKRIFGKQKRDGGWNIYEKSRKSTTRAKSIFGLKQSLSMEQVYYWIRKLQGEWSFTLQTIRTNEVCILLAPLNLNEAVYIISYWGKWHSNGFLAGSGTTAHALLELNAQDSRDRQFITVQIPEKCDKDSVAYKAGYKTILI